MSLRVPTHELLRNIYFDMVPPEGAGGGVIDDGAGVQGIIDRVVSACRSAPGSATAMEKIMAICRPAPGPIIIDNKQIIIDKTVGIPPNAALSPAQVAQVQAVLQGVE